jgi:hypothetical protein
MKTAAEMPKNKRPNLHSYTKATKVAKNEEPVELAAKDRVATKKVGKFYHRGSLQLLASLNFGCTRS